MKKTLLMSAALAALVLGAPLTSHAEDAVISEDAATESVQSFEEEIMVKELTLKDGTKVLVKGEDVFVIDAYGAETPALDGVHVLEDDTSVTTKDGKIVHPEESVTEELGSEE
ncbi:MAG: hypothetical protein H6861_08050 [Rhodospirillales bacterium]|nr:hypothetical protein [Rhodospirillales bacterium]